MIVLFSKDQLVIYLTKKGLSWNTNLINKRKEVKKMKDKECECRHGGHLFVVAGVFALVYGVVNYLRVTYVWPPYMGWIVGGVILLVLGWLKKYYWKKPKN
jgi:hypothetical protein